MNGRKLSRDPGNVGSAGNAEPQLGNIKDSAELGLGVPGKRFWMREYWDRYIRNENHLERVVEYIHGNPVSAGLCVKLDDWPWSSARFYVKNTSRNGELPGNAEPQLGHNNKIDAKLGLGVPSESKL